MAITKNHKRLANKRGWYDGHSKRDKESYPYDEIQMCIEYENGYYEGLDADINARNPYGIYTD